MLLNAQPAQDSGILVLHSVTLSAQLGWQCHCSRSSRCREVWVLLNSAYGLAAGALRNLDLQEGIELGPAASAWLQFVMSPCCLGKPLFSTESLSLTEVARELDRETLQRLKRECGGLQTLLRNSHQVFEGEGRPGGAGVGCPSWARQVLHAGLGFALPFFLLHQLKNHVISGERTLSEDPGDGANSLCPPGHQHPPPLGGAVTIPPSWILLPLVQRGLP